MTRITSPLLVPISIPGGAMPTEGKPSATGGQGAAPATAADLQPSAAPMVEGIEFESHQANELFSGLDRTNQAMQGGLVRSLGEGSSSKAGMGFFSAEKALQKEKGEEGLGKQGASAEGTEKSSEKTILREPQKGLPGAEAQKEAPASKDTAQPRQIQRSLGELASQGAEKNSAEADKAGKNAQQGTNLAGKMGSTAQGAATTQGAATSGGAEGLAGGAHQEGVSQMPGAKVLAQMSAQATLQEGATQGKAASHAAQQAKQGASTEEGTLKSSNLRELLMEETRGTSQEMTRSESPAQQMKQLVFKWATAQEAVALQNLHTVMAHDVGGIAQRIASLAQQGVIPSADLLQTLVKALKKPGQKKLMNKIKDMLAKKGVSSSCMSSEMLTLIAAMVATLLAKGGDDDAEALVIDLFDKPSREMWLPEGGGSEHEEGRREQESEARRHGENIEKTQVL